MLIVDAQQNIAFNAQQLGRDFSSWAWHQRQHEATLKAPPATTSLRDNLLGRLAIVFASIAVISESSRDLQSWQRYTWRTAGDAQQLALWQLDHYRRLADDNDKIQLILTQADLATVLSSWDDDDQLDQHLQGIVIQLKGAEPIAEPKQFEDWLEFGVRIVAPAFGLEPLRRLRQP